MKKVDRLNWKEFCVGNLFDIHPTKAYKITNKDLLVENGENPVVVNSAYNNGVGGYTNLDVTEKGNTITFSDTTTADAIFYQESCFVGYPHVQGLYPKCYGDKWSKYSLLFFLAVFKKASFVQNFDYANKFTRDLAKNIIVSLPSDSAGIPDFAYMEEYMKDIFEKTRQKLLKQQKINPAKTFINVNDWKDFHLYDLFVIDSGTSLDKVKMGTNNPEINFVGRANANRGISCQVNKLPGIEPYESGTLTLSLGGAYLGSCFVQEKPFYTSQNVFVLIPKTNMSRMAKDFIATMIFKESQIHYKAFIDELNRHIKRDFVIKLPVNSEGNPDFAYMESYMKGVMEKQRANLDVLQMLLIGR